MQVLNGINDRFDRQASESGSEQEKDSFFTQLAPEPISIKPLQFKRTFISIK